MAAFNFYTVGTSLAFLIWLFFFILQDRDQKIRMLKYSLFLSAFGPFSQIWYLRDYWTVDQFQLTYSARIITDLVLAATLAGLGAVALDAILKKSWKLSNNLRLTPIILFPYLFFGIWYIYHVVRTHTSTLAVSNIYRRNMKCC